MNNSAWYKWNNITHNLSQNLKITGSVEKQVAGLQISMQYVCRVNVFEPTKNLIEEITDVIIAQFLSFEQFVQVGLH